METTAQVFVLADKKFVVELVKKTKKNEPKIFPALLQIDRDAFDSSKDSVTILKTFWRSTVNLMIVARKPDTGAILGYAAFLPTLENDTGSYLMRIAVRTKCQRHGIGRALVQWLLDKYPAQLELDVSVDNERAVRFYQRVGLSVKKTYFTQDSGIEFVTFSTDKPGCQSPIKTIEESKESQEEIVSEDSTTGSAIEEISQ